MSDVIFHLVSNDHGEWQLAAAFVQEYWPWAYQHINAWSQHYASRARTPSRD